MVRVSEKRLRLRRRRSNDVIYPKTLASLVKTNDGKTVQELLANSEGAGFYAIPITLYPGEQGFTYDETGDIDLDQLSSCAGISLTIDASAFQEGLILSINYCLTRLYEVPGQFAMYEFGSYTPEPGEVPSLLQLAFEDGELVSLEIDPFEEEEPVEEDGTDRYLTIENASQTAMGVSARTKKSTGTAFHT